MGNQLCQGNNNNQSSFEDYQIKQTGNIVAVQKLIQKELDQFFAQNAIFFTTSKGQAIKQTLLKDQNICDIIRKMHKVFKKQQKTIYIQNDSINQIQNYVGQCILLNPNKSELYIGQIKNLQKDGKGCLIDKKGNKFTGYFIHNQRKGQGTFVILYPKRIYKGNFKGLKLQGSGQVLYEDGAHYFGHFQNGKKHGRGILTFQDGTVYDGEFQKDLMHGEGTLTTAKGKEISGQWIEGKYNQIKPHRSSHTFTINQVYV